MLGDHLLPEGLVDPGCDVYLGPAARQHPLRSLGQKKNLTLGVVLTWVAGQKEKPGLVT